MSVNLPRLRALSSPGYVLEEGEMGEWEALTAAACAELEAWRTRFEHDDPDGFDVYEDDDDGGFYTVSHPTAEELAERACRRQENQWAAESRRRAPLWPPPPDPNEVVGARSDGSPVTRGMLGEGSEALQMAQYLRRWDTSRNVYILGESPPIADDFEARFGSTEFSQVPGSRAD